MLDIEPLVTSIEALNSVTARAERVRLLARIRTQLEELQRADERSKAELETALKGVEGAEARRAALASRKDESATAEALLPRILSLQRYLTDTSENDDPEAHELLQNAILVVVGYAGGYQDVRDHLIKLDAEHGEDTATVLSAQPSEGDIDYPALSREHIRRYPKIRARLAE
jgi:hypothetical protein